MQRWDLIQIRLRPEFKALIKAKAERADVPVSALVQYAIFNLGNTDEQHEEIRQWYSNRDHMIQRMLSDDPPSPNVVIEGENGPLFEEA